MVAGYSPLGGGISPLLAMEEARAVGAIVAFPAFADPGQAVPVPRRGRSAGGPIGILQPKRTAPPVEPDVILVPLIAVDGRGTRLGRGKGHYDRVLAPAAPQGRAPDRLRLGGPADRPRHPPRPVGRADGRVCVPGRS